MKPPILERRTELPKPIDKCLQNDLSAELFDAFRI